MFLFQNEENLTEKVRVLEKELERIKKEGHKRKKLLMEQQHLIESGADNFHKVRSRNEIVLLYMMF